jgi:N-acetylglucosaminyl-diphospho-decaprenol L-rhamnosyltransferase
VAPLNDCLVSLREGEPSSNFNVFVVDNNSSDGSAGMVHSRFPDVHLIRSGKNGGYAFGNNIALRQILAARPGQDSEHEYVLLLNPDTEIEAGCISTMLSYMEAHPEAGVAGPKVVRPDGSLDLACRRSFPTPAVSFARMTGLSKIFPKNPVFARYNLTYLDPDQPAEVDSVTGAFMLMRRRALEEAGLLDERFFMYGEDLDLAFRIKEKGWKVLYNPAAIVVHHKGVASRKRSSRSIYEFYRAMHVFYHKHYAADAPALFTWLINFGIASRAATSLTINFMRPDDKKRVA